MIIIIGMMLAPTAMNNIITVSGDVPQGAVVQIDQSTATEDGYVMCTYENVSEWANMVNLALTPNAAADELNGIDAYVNNGNDYTVLSADGISLLEEANADAATLAGTAAWKNWVVAIFTVAVIVIAMFFAKGFLKLIPILIGIVAGYLLALALGMVDTSPVASASWFALPEVQLPATTNWNAIIYAITMIAPISVVTFVEHVGGITIGTVSVSGTAIAAVLGVVLNKILPKVDADEKASQSVEA